MSIVSDLGFDDRILNLIDGLAVFVDCIMEAIPLGTYILVENPLFFEFVVDNVVVSATDEVVFGVAATVADVGGASRCFE
jgi:hypothetical protein